MKLFGMNSDRNCSIIPYISIVFSRKNGIKPNSFNWNSQKKKQFIIHVQLFVAKLAYITCKMK